MMRTKVVVPATGHVLTLQELREQVEIVPIDGDSDGGTHPDDNLLLGYLDSAVGMAENFTGLSIALKTYEGVLDEFPCGTLPIEIAKPPLVELLSFTSSLDSDGEVDPDTYIVDDFGDMASLKPYSAWPYITPTPLALRLRFRAGYSSEDSDAQPLPAVIRQALLLTVAEWYKNRENTADGATPEELPNAATALLRPERVRLGMA